MPKPIYLIDLTHESKLGLGSDTMPLQLGLVASYCKKIHGDKIDIQIFKFVDEFIKAVEENPPFLIGSSNYLWNIDLSYKLISLIKEKHPEIVTVFGGPNYPDVPAEQIEWLKNYPNIDFYIYKDGEVPFARLVGRLLGNPDVKAIQKEKLPSCHALVDDKPYFGELEPRLTDLDEIPSPYVAGLMDKFFEHKLIPPIRTNRGCPFTCAYCTEGGPYYTKIYKNSFAYKKAEIDYIVKKVKHTKTLRIADSNFAMYEEDIDFCKYLGEIQEKTGYPEYITCSTGKNQKDRVLKCNELLHGAIRLTASVQSLDPEVLKNVKRVNIALDDIMALSDQVSDTDTFSYSEIILALPGDSLESEKKSMAGLIQAGISNITQHQLAIIYGTELAAKASREKYKMKSMFRPIQRCVGTYSFNGQSFPSVEIEEICIQTEKLSLADYFEARRFYLTVGMFYNDRIFGEIHALLRILNLPTWDWLMVIHDYIKKNPSKISELYDGFMADTKNELWETPAALIKDVSANVDKYNSGELGGNIIYKYRSQAIAIYFPKLHEIAFECLKIYLADKNVDQNIIEELERFSRYQKDNLFDLNFEKTEVFNYDIVKMIKDVSWVRQGGILKDINQPTKIRIAHNDEQKEIIQRQLDFYGTDIGGLTMLVSRFPIKRFYRKAEVVE